MSAPQGDIEGELTDYMSDKGIDRLFLELAESLLAHKPANPVSHIMGFLADNYPDLTRLPFLAAFDMEEDNPADSDEDKDEDDDDEVRGDKALHRRSKQRRHAVSAASLELAQLETAPRPRRYPKSEQEAARAKELLLRTTILPYLPIECIDAVLPFVAPISPEPGEVLYTQGSWGSSKLYVVDTGQVNLITMQRQGQGIETTMPKRAGACFGEECCMYSCPRASSAKVVLDGTKLFSVDRQSLLLGMLTYVDRRRQSHLAYIASLPLFAPLTEMERLHLADAMWTEDYAPGDILMRQNDAASKCFFIDKGEVSCIQQDSPIATPVELCRLTRGDCVGEMGLLTDRPRLASVIAKAPTKCVVIDRPTAKRVLGPIMDILKRDPNLHKQYMARKL